MSIATWIIGIVVALAFGASGLAKITGQPAMREASIHVGVPWERFRMLGFAEVAGAAGVIIGLIWSKAMPLAVAAAIGLALVGLGGVYFHIKAGDKPKDYAPAGVLGVLAIVFAILIAAK